MFDQKLKHNQLTLPDLLSKDRRGVGYVSSQPRFNGTSFSLIEEA